MVFLTEIDLVKGLKIMTNRVLAGLAGGLFFWQRAPPLLIAIRRVLLLLKAKEQSLRFPILPA
jgi:hypothetical protein